MRYSISVITILIIVLFAACTSIPDMDDSDPQTFTFLVSQSPYKSLKDPAYVALPMFLRVKNDEAIFTLDKVGLDPKGDALYVDKLNSRVIIGEGQFYLAYDQTGRFTGILNGNTGIISLVTDDNFPQEHIQQDVKIIYYRNSSDQWIKVVS